MSGPLLFVTLPVVALVTCLLTAHWAQHAGQSMQDTACRTEHAGYRLQNKACRTQHAGQSTQKHSILKLSLHNPLLHSAPCLLQALLPLFHVSGFLPHGPIVVFQPLNNSNMKSQHVLLKSAVQHSVMLGPGLCIQSYAS